VWTSLASESEGDGHTSRAVGKQGLAVDSLVSERGDMSAARQSFTEAVKRHGAPERITLDGHPATRAAVADFKRGRLLRPQTKVRTSKHLNDLVERDHRSVKRRIYPTPGFKDFGSAAVTISGIELVQEIKKGQLDTPKSIDGGEARTPQVWQAALAA
jgi:transposase-like protein